MPLDQIGRLKSEILRCFWEFRMMEVLGDIPLGYTLEKLMKKKDEQFYIPKIETILWWFYRSIAVYLFMMMHSNIIDCLSQEEDVDDRHQVYR